MMGRTFPPYLVRRLWPDTFIIHHGGCDCYLLLGEEKAVLIDAGMSPRNLKDLVDTLTDLPLLGVINTHEDYDHVLGNGYFKDAYMHPLAVESVKNTLKNYPDYNRDYHFHTLRDGEIIDLGGRQLEIIYIGAHSLSSIAILDKSRRMLFTGDEIDTGQAIINFRGEKVKGKTVETHLKNMKKLKEREEEFDLLFPGHNGTPIHKSYIDDFIAADELVLSGVPGREDISSSTLPSFIKAPEGARRQNVNWAHIIYNINTIFEDQI